MPELIEHMYEWIENHPQVENSPISNNKLLFPDHKQPGKKKRVYKFLLRISISELHNYLIYEIIIYQLKEEIDESTGNPLISDTNLRVLMPKNVQKMTDRLKHMCGCKIYVII